MANKRLTKTQFVEAVAEKSKLTKKQVNTVLSALNETVAVELGRRGRGEVVIPGLLKLIVVNKPATSQHEGVNPFTKEPMTYKAKAARKVIKVRPLQALRDAV